MFIKKRIFACGIAVLFSLLMPFAAAASGKEQLVKAAFLFNFTKFVSWPSPYAINEISEMTICQLGQDDLGSGADVLKKGSTAALKINTKIITSPPTEPGICHIIYVTSNNQIQSAIANAKYNKALTVSNADKFTNQGGMIGFVNEDNKIRLHINKTAAENAGLKLDAQLLEIARKVIR